MAWHRGQAYGQDLRDRVLSCQGTIHQVAQRFAVSESYVARVRARRRRLGEDTPGVQCNHVPLRLAQLRQALASEVAQHADQTLAQLCEWTQREHGVRVALSTMHKTLRRIGLSLKKRHSMPVSRSEATRRLRAAPGVHRQARCKARAWSFWTKHGPQRA